MRSGRGRSRWLGSSPLTRGKLELDAHARRIPRLIPAHAGKTCSQARSLGSRAAHPRSRGENLTDPSRQLQDPGSSPLTRGKRLPRYHWYQFYRLIPAHAGKTPRSRAFRGCLRAHPRSRGENTAKPVEAGWAEGSSPLTRGKHVVPKLGTRFSGLIPAHAGKTRPAPASTIRREAHPRSRGENPFHRRAPHRSTGSSPLTRGKRFCPPHGGRFVRLIPAHAGKTTVGDGVHFGVPAHPRSRGENPRHPVGRQH